MTRTHHYRLPGILLLMALLTGCAGGVNFQAPVVGGLYAEYRAPFSGGVDAMPYKVGTSECRTILGWFATGDCSIGTAAKRGNIARIHHVDYEFKHILGIVGTYTTIVYGE